jgi:hypothetical protein
MVLSVSAKREVVKTENQEENPLDILSEADPAGVVWRNPRRGPPLIPFKVFFMIVIDTSVRSEGFPNHCKTVNS